MGWDREYGNDQLSFVTRVGAGAAIGNEQIFGYLLTEPEIRVGFNTDIGLGLSSGLAVNWGNRMKTHLETGKTFYLDGTDRSRFMIKNLWEWNTWSAFSVSYESINQDYSEDRYKVGVNLYF